MCFWRYCWKFPVTVARERIQLLVVARALAEQASFLLLDEPTSHLDLGNKKWLITCLQNLRENGTTILLTSHEPEVVATLADQMVLMRGGQVLRSGLLDEVWQTDLLSETYGIPLRVWKFDGRHLTWERIGEFMDGELWIISGEIGQGKTRWCGHLIRLAREVDWQVSGVLGPGVFQEGYKVGIEALDLRSGERRLQARRRQVNQAGLIHTRKWQFETETVEWGNTLFQQAVPSDLLVVDEIGPLKLEQGRGWSAEPYRQLNRGHIGLRWW